MDAHRERLNTPARFGNTLRLREDARDVWGWSWLDTLVRDVSLAWRALRRAPGFTIAVLTSLTLGLALTASTLGVFNAYLLRSLPYPDADRLYHVQYAPPGPVEPGAMSAIDWSVLRDVVEHPITATGATFYLADGGYAQPSRGLRVSAGFSAGLGIAAMLGRTFDEGDFRTTAEPVALLGHATWRHRFGADSAIIGRPLRADAEEHGAGAESFRVIGVLTPGFWYGRDSDAAVDVLVPLRGPARTYMVRLRDGVSPGAAERRLTEAARAVATSLPPGWMGVTLESARERYVASLRPVLVGVTLATGLVLLIACVNVAVLMLLRAMRRRKEMGVRVALGAGRRHLLRMLVAEATLLCAGALVSGLLLTRVLLRLLAPLVTAQLGRPAPGGSAAIALDGTVLLLIGSTGVLIALALSFFPLLAPWQGRLADALRRESRGGTDGRSMRRVRSVLVAVEVAGSVVLVVGAGLLIRSAVTLLRTDLGFETRHLVRASLAIPSRAYPDRATSLAFYQRVTERVGARTGSPVAWASWPPFAETPPYPVVAGAVSDDAAAGVISVGAGYFELLGIPLRQGRSINAEDLPGTEPVAVISATLAGQLWPDGSALGRRIRVVDQTGTVTPSEVWRTVVGVAGDVRQTYDDPDQRDVYLAFYQASPGRFGAFYLRSDRPVEAVLTDVRATIAETDPLAIVRGASLVASQDRQLAGTRFLTSILTGFAGFAGFLAMLGIYGVIAYTVQQREREVAIRIAVGASRRSVIGLFLWNGSLVLAGGIAGGVLGAAAAGRVLASRLHGVAPFDPPTLLAACVVMAGAGLAAIWWPARRAAAVSPMATLNET